MREDAKPRGGQINDDNQEGTCFLGGGGFSCDLVRPLVKTNKIDRNSDSKSTVRTHGCLLHGSWLPSCRLENMSSGEILVILEKSPEEDDEE